MQVTLKLGYSRIYVERIVYRFHVAKLW